MAIELGLLRVESEHGGQEGQSWASGFHDFDQDGDEDLIVFNGHVYPNATCEVMDAEFLEPPLLYTREAEKFVRLEARQAGQWLDQAHCDRGAVFGDIDGDGDTTVTVRPVGDRGGPHDPNLPLAAIFLRNPKHSQEWCPPVEYWGRTCPPLPTSRINRQTCSHAQP